MLEVLHQAPQLLGFDESRWTLRTIRRVLCLFGITTQAGVYLLLKRLGIARKRGRDYIHSPDPLYCSKVLLERRLLEEVRKSNTAEVALFLDEMSIYRQPSVSLAYEEQGHHYPLAARSTAANSLSRVVGALDAVSGRLIYERRSQITLGVLERFLFRIAQSYASARRIYVFLDNWPLHFHPDLFALLEPQEWEGGYHRPANWPKEPSKQALDRYSGLRLPIQLIPLPTYAPWTNPIEKVWHFTKRRVLHLHPFANDLRTLRQKVDEFLDQFQYGSDELLRYTGLST